MTLTAAVKTWIKGPGTALVVLFLVAGCSGITPFEPRNNREEGPEKGLFTGSRGEFVISGGNHPEADQQEETQKSKTE